MTQEDKNLLIKDLCGRVPYGVKFRYKYIAYFHEKYGTSTLDSVIPPYHIMHSALGKEYLQLERDEIKPYLFPLSSMTEEQKKYIDDRWGIKDFDFEINPDWGQCLVLTLGDMLGFVNWLIENHFDVNGLIPMGLAIDASNLNIYWYEIKIKRHRIE